MSGQADQFERDALNAADFISQHQVFRLEEFETAYRRLGRKPSSARAALAYHVNRGRLWLVKRSSGAAAAT
ncbi:MAG: hypothetical protein Q8L48_24620 [Archangium sp.]|nr:hypothetical protein [Archangium sp.]